MHFNINGLKNKTQLLESEICDMKNLNFLCITEHQLTGGDFNDINISNYKIASIFSRNDAKCGGSLIMTNVDFIENVIIKNMSRERHFECSAIDTDIGNLKCTIVCIYRPPTGNLELFFKLFEKIKIFVTRKNRVPIYYFVET